MTLWTRSRHCVIFIIIQDICNPFAPYLRSSRRSGEFGSSEVREGGTGSTPTPPSAKDRLLALASSKSITSEIIKIGNKVLSPTRAEKRNSTVSLYSRVIDIDSLKLNFLSL